ncbi:Uncharacterised protein [Salmonella enterica subsp. enterica serovar Bovismorbificans]|uniref:Uncharacterized protein n=1 Tax=Salmonella enterica subsp. enterica serovar Bovismorbificans TaxID=58097 RepID=A0A655DQR1_SALET|nr:Uncharacterised protein [Salmonella enterica subsp. enterica serovar Bovismorbificans]
MHIDAKPRRANAFRPFTRLNPFCDVYHAAGSGQHQRHHRIGNGFRQNGRRVHQDYFAGSKGVHLDIIVSHRDGRRRA